MLQLPVLTISGTPRALGHAYGEACRPHITAYIAQRFAAARAYLGEHGHAGIDRLCRNGAACLQMLEAWHHDGWTEHMAVAEAAGVSAVDLYTAGNMTDIRDTVVLGSMSSESEGCTTAHAGPSLTREGRILAGQTWDLNPSDLDFVIAVHRKPAHGPQTWSVTCAGCPSLIGMNEQGIAVGTTNIKVRGSRIGIPYLSILHRMLGERRKTDALSILQSTPRAGAHTYWIADADAVTDVECTPTDAVVRETSQYGYLTRSNHCLVPAHAAIEGEAASPSSHARLARASAVLAAGNVSIASLRQLFADRSDGINSINRFAEDNQGTSTNACIIAEPVTRTIHACRGSSDRGAWISHTFGK